MRLITDVLREIRKGRAVDLASERLADLVRAVDETNKPGTITITLKVKPAKGGGSEKTIAVDVKAEDPGARSAGSDLLLGSGRRPAPLRSHAKRNVHRGRPRLSVFIPSSLRSLHVQY